MGNIIAFIATRDHFIGSEQTESCEESLGVSSFVCFLKLSTAVDSRCRLTFLVYSFRLRKLRSYRWFCYHRRCPVVLGLAAMGVRSRRKRYLSSSLHRSSDRFISRECLTKGQFVIQNEETIYYKKNAFWIIYSLQ